MIVYKTNPFMYVYIYICVCITPVYTYIYILLYSMNSLFSELFRKFGGVFLETCKTISKGIWEVFGGIIENNYPEQVGKQI